MVLIELLAIVLAAVVLGVLALFRVKHDWDWGDMSVIIVGVVLASPLYLGVFLMAYEYGLRSLFPALPAVHLPWWPPASGG